MDSETPVSTVVRSAVDISEPPPPQTPDLAQWLATPPAPVDVQSAENGDEIWVELPTDPDRAPRTRRRRGRGDKSRTTTDIAGADLVEVDQPQATEATQPAIEAVETTAEVAVDPIESEQEIVTAPVQPENIAPPEPEAIEVVAETPPPLSPPPAPVPDPAEISAPPVQPKRGWWRKGS